MEYHPTSKALIFGKENILMMKINKVIVLIIILFWTVSCSQDNKNYQKIMKEIINSVPNPPGKQPVYDAIIDSRNCNWEVFVNDVSSRFSGGVGSVHSYLSLNKRILSSGKQKIRIRIFPLEGKTQLGEKATFKIRGKYYSNKRDMKQFDSFLAFELPYEETKNLSYFEKTFEFDADVPYHLKGWTASKDLTTVPNLEEKVLAKLEGLKEMIKTKNDSLFLKSTKQRWIEYFTSFYGTKEEIEANLQGGLSKNFEGMYDIQFLPIKNYQLVLQGNNRIVELKMEVKDTSCSGILIIGKNKNDYRVEDCYPFYFHIPQDSNELEVIR